MEKSMNKAIYIGCDHGNKMIKGSTGIYYNSGYICTGSQEPIVKNNLLLYRNEYVSIGQGRFPVMIDKTLDDRFFILTLPAIAHAIESEGIHGSEIVLWVIPICSTHVKNICSKPLQKIPEVFYNKMPPA